MKRILVMLLLVANLGAIAQTTGKKSTKAKPKAKAEKQEVTEGTIMMEGVVEAAPVLEEVRAVAVEDYSRSGPVSTEEDGLFYLQETISDKDVSVAYKGQGYGNKRYALIVTSTKRKLTPFVFESLSTSYNNRTAITVILNGKYGVINYKGESVIPCIYDELNSFTLDDQTYYIASTGGKAGIITETGDVMLPFEYNKLEKSYYNPSNLFVARKGEMYGVINILSKEVVVPFIYNGISTERDYLRVSRDNQYNLLAWDGRLLFKNWYSHINVYDELIIAELNGRRGIIDMTEKQLVPFEYDRLERISTGEDRLYNFIAVKNGLHGMLSKTGAVLVPFEYSDLNRVGYSSYLVCTKNGLKGMLDMTGAVVLPVENSILSLHDKVILLKKGDKYGLIKTDNSVLLPVKYDLIKPVSMDGAYRTTNFLLKLNGKYGIFSNTGEMLMEMEYDNILPAVYSRYSSDNDLYRTPVIAVKNGKYGMVDLKNMYNRNSRILIPFEYEELAYLNTFLVIAKKKGKYGVREIYAEETMLPYEYKFLNHKENMLVGYKNAFEHFKITGKMINPVTGKTNNQ